MASKRKLYEEAVVETEKIESKIVSLKHRLENVKKRAVELKQEIAGKEEEKDKIIDLREGELGRLAYHVREMWMEDPELGYSECQGDDCWYGGNMDRADGCMISVFEQDYMACDVCLANDFLPDINEGECELDLNDYDPKVQEKILKKLEEFRAEKKEEEEEESE